MRRKILILAALILAISIAGTVQAQPFIGLFDEDNGVNCEAEITLFEFQTVYVIAFLDGIEEITAAEFRIADIPEPGEFGLRTDNWSTPLVIGSVEHGIALAFNPPMEGPLVLLGTMEFFMIDESWIPPNHCMNIEPSLASDLLVVVDGNYDTVDVNGYVFNFNITTGDWFCWTCPDVTPTEKSSFSTLKSLY